jgi:hypothetical protein
MLGHARLQRGQPVGIGRGIVGEQPVALAHRRFVACRMMRMAGEECQRQPVEEAAALARAIGEQPVHRRREPQYAHPFGQRSGGGGGAVDPHQPALRRIGLGARADIRLVQSRGDAESAAAPLARHFGERRTPQAAAGREQRQCLEHIGLARAVLPAQHHETGAGGERGVRMVAEIGEDEAGYGHSRPIADRAPGITCP